MSHYFCTILNTKLFPVMPNTLGEGSWSAHSCGTFLAHTVHFPRFTHGLSVFIKPQIWAVHYRPLNHFIVLIWMYNCRYYLAGIFTHPALTSLQRKLFYGLEDLIRVCKALIHRYIYYVPLYPPECTRFGLSLVISDHKT